MEDVHGHHNKIDFAKMNILDIQPFYKGNGIILSLIGCEFNLLVICQENGGIVRETA